MGDPVSTPESRGFRPPFRPPRKLWSRWGGESSKPLNQWANWKDQATRKLGRYLRLDLRADLVAGLTVAVMGVPQAMAYALIAGLPPVFGLYTAIITCVVAALIGSSNHLVTGPTNALCMVLLSLTASLPQKYDVDPISAMLLITFMTGAIQMAFGLLGLGRIIRYVSHSVVIGFTAGAGILIAVNQLKNILGVSLADAHADRFHEVLIATFRNAADTNFYALGIAVTTAVIVIVAERIDRRIPGALLGIVTTGAISFLCKWHFTERPQRVEIVKDIQPIEGTLPVFTIPDLIAHPAYDLTRDLAVGAVALAFLGLIEAASIARSVAASSKQRLNFSREFVGQGASNIVGSFFSCFAGSGSFTRTAVCFKSGGRTRMAAAFSAGWTTVALLALGPVANFIPKAALAGVLIVIAYSMIDKQRLQMTWRSGKNPRMVLVGTLASTLILPLEWAIFVGVFLSLVIVLRSTGKTDLTQLVARDDSGFDELPFQRAAPSPVVIVNMEGDLYFAAAEDLDYELLRCITPETRVVVLRMKRLRTVGSTAMAMLEHFWSLLRGRDIYLVVCGIEDELEAVLTGSGVRKQIGEQNIFYADNKLFQSTELALARAWSIVKAEKRARESGKETGSVRPVDRHSAQQIMNTRCVRFGNQHQLREAVWLMSGLQERSKKLSPEPLFLQDREATLAGELTPWRIMQTLTQGLDGQRSDELDDKEVGALLRREFTQPINKICRVDEDRVYREDSLARLLEKALEDDLHVIPICDQEGRVKGLVSSDDLLRTLHQAMPQDRDSAANDSPANGAGNEPVKGQSTESEPTESESTS